MKPIDSVLETVLYSTDLESAHSFYRDVLGLAPLEDPSGLATGFRMNDTHVLLIFNPRISGQPGRDLPLHGPHGEGHIAFRIAPEDFEAWKKHLRERGVSIEQVREWEQGGRSIYCRDPHGNSIELIDSDIWPSTSE